MIISIKKKDKKMKTLKVLSAVTGVLLLCCGTNIASGLTISQPLVSAPWLAQNSGHFILVDVRERLSYLEGHIPGAINIPVDDLQTKPDYILLPVPELNKILREKGIDRSREVVLYGEGREDAYLEYWMLDYLGLKCLHVLNGGIELWKGELSTEEQKLPSSVFAAKPDRRKYATTAYVKNNLKNPNVIILDVRTPAEYMGSDVRSLRGGHIPGAVNMNSGENYIEDTTELKPLSELAARYAKLSRKKEIVTYCQTGTRAANVYFVLKALGFPRVRNYDASWVVWGTRLDLPADDVSYFNFVPMIRELKRRVQGTGK